MFGHACNDSLALVELLFSREGLWETCCLVPGFLTYDFFCASYGPQGTTEAQVPACCLGPPCVGGAGRIGQALFRGLYVTSTAAAFLERRAAEERLGGVAAVGAVETVDGGLCGVRMEHVANGVWDVERGRRGRGGVDEGDAGACKDFVGCHRTDTQHG